MCNFWLQRMPDVDAIRRTFQTAADGSAATLASAPGGLQAYVGVGVTDEPLGGSGTPSTPMLMYWVI